ncbi:MAG: hypothetical protein ACREIT_07205 [Tepidisphaeraceae bacterium]
MSLKTRTAATKPPRIGELLRTLAPISAHDVEEILHEQRSTGHRFGQIALAWGLCQPEHVWTAWSTQLGSAPRHHVDLDELGIDAQATAYLRRDLAVEFQAVPVRVLGDQLIIATSEGTYDRARTELPRHVSHGTRVQFILAHADQIACAIETYYPTLDDSG